jgi:hypothetical protein
MVKWPLLNNVIKQDGLISLIAQAFYLRCPFNGIVSQGDLAVLVFISLERYELETGLGLFFIFMTFCILNKVDIGSVEDPADPGESLPPKQIKKSNMKKS